MYAIPTTEEFKKARTYLEELVENGFGDWESMSYAKWYDAYSHVLEAKGWEVHDGCTKSVVIFDDLNWVIKCDLEGCDYCEKEVANWECAIKEGFTTYLAATYFLDCKNGINFYIQEYAASDTDYYDSKCYEYYHSDSESYEDEGYWEPDDEEMVVALIGGPQVGMFMRFCWELDINDLHAGNFGQTKDGRTVIFDYSGY